MFREHIVGDRDCRVVQSGRKGVVLELERGPLKINPILDGPQWQAFLSAIRKARRSPLAGFLFTARKPIFWKQQKVRRIIVAGRPTVTVATSPAKARLILKLGWTDPVILEYRGVFFFVRRELSAEKSMVFLAGPRQSGKTTLSDEQPSIALRPALQIGRPALNRS